MRVNNHTHENNSQTRKKSNLLYVEMGKRLRILRIELNYTQEQMSEILGMSPAYYGKVERGIHGLSLQKRLLVNQKLDVDINYLLSGSKKSEITLETIIEGCPKNKRYDMEQLIKCAIKLVKETE